MFSDANYMNPSCMLKHNRPEKSLDLLLNNFLELY